MMASRLGSSPPSSRRLPVAALQPVSERSGAHVALHVFCPRVVAATLLRDCRDCPSCVEFDPGDDDGARPSVLCGHGSGA